jgi:hypothetical protein
VCVTVSAADGREALATVAASNPANQIRLVRSASEITTPPGPASLVVWPGGGSGGGGDVAHDGAGTFFSLRPSGRWRSIWCRVRAVRESQNVHRGRSS